MKYIASKLSYDQSFVFYTGTAPFAVEKVIVVKGGSNVRDPKTLVMPQGVITELSDEERKAYAVEELQKVNRTLPGFQQVSRITVRDTDFQRSPAMKIVRYGHGANKN